MIKIIKIMAGEYQVKDYTYGCGSPISISKDYDGFGWNAFGNTYETLKDAKVNLNEMAKCGEFLKK